MDCESVSGLLCQETDACPDDDEVVAEDMFIGMTQGGYGDLDGEERYVEMLFDRENSSGFKRVHQSLELDNWVKCARKEAINWILKTREIFGFRLQTAYLSMTYFDRFLSKRSIDSGQSWAIRLLSVACLSLAAKMEEIKTPSLSQFQIGKYNFESRAIQRMELLVLSALEWKMISITPFAFVHYFITKFCKPIPPRLMISKTAGFALAAMREINLMDYRPSVIAIAATLVALDQSLTRQALECKMNSISCSEIEDVFQCYVLMQKVEAENIKTTKPVNSPDLPPTLLRPMDVSENSSVASAISTKRKGPTFNNVDQNNELPSEKRLR